MEKIGIIGCGFVGSAIAAGFSLKADVRIFDKQYPVYGTLKAVCEQDILFLCLPTPQRSEIGRPDMTFIHEAIQSIKKEIKDTNKIIVIKSTILPGTCRSLTGMYPQFDFIANPEFLTARSAKLDFINSSRVVIGGENQIACCRLGALYSQINGHSPIFFCSWEAAELVKYAANCFLAMKISYFNEIYDVCQELKCNYNEVKEMVLADGRIGNSHHEVPGHDGDRGFGGSCFPKDIEAFTWWADMKGLLLDTLEAAKKVNKRIRRNIDWQLSREGE